MTGLRRITFIRPNFTNCRSSDAMEPLVFAILAGLTPKHIKVELIDERLEDVSIRDTDLCAITVETYTARRAYEIAAAYRARNIPVIMGGYHPTLMPDEAALHADAIVIGDAEPVWGQILKDVEANRLQPRYFSRDNQPSLEGVSFDRSVFHNKKYAPIMLIQAGRGCRFACDFCSIHAFYGTNIRMRPLDDILTEVKASSRFKPIFFVDDNLFGRRDDFVRFLKALKPLKRIWTCQISIDVGRDEELLDLMAEAGCFLALIGFESLGKDQLRQMGKRWNKVSGDYASVVTSFRKRGISVYGTFVAGYDADRVDVFDAVLEFATQSRLAIANFNSLMPMPGTALLDRLKIEGRMTSENWWIDPGFVYNDVPFRPVHMTPQELSMLSLNARQKFYSLRSIIKRILTDTALLRRPLRLAPILLANIISRREISRKHALQLGQRKVHTQKTTNGEGQPCG